MKRAIKDIAAKEWNAARTKIKTLEEEVNALWEVLPRALDPEFVKRQMAAKEKEIEELKKLTEPKL
ncbi:MAG: hypothetical protein II972_03950 [Elusimicrobiaceae bacterium]|nr:hypothetical protein [Elusimicrobiaceae bacterium]